MKVNFSIFNCAGKFVGKNNCSTTNLSFAANNLNETGKKIANKVYPDLRVLAHDVDIHDKQDIKETANVLYGVINDASVDSVIDKKAVIDELYDIAFEKYRNPGPDGRYYNQMREIIFETQKIIEEEKFQADPKRPQMSTSDAIAIHNID